MTVALSGNGTAGINTIQTHTLKDVKFSGSSSYTVPQGALVVSDPIDLAVAAQSILTVTMYLVNGQPGSPITSHPGSRTTSWFALGNQVSAASLGGESLKSAAHWYLSLSIFLLPDTI